MRTPNVKPYFVVMPTKIQNWDKSPKIKIKYKVGTVQISAKTLLIPDCFYFYSLNTVVSNLGTKFIRIEFLEY